MLDGGKVEDPNLAPTRANIVSIYFIDMVNYLTRFCGGSQLREIQNLVQDAEYGDRFVFHCK